MNSLKENNYREKNEQCHCNEIYKIIENYRSILDRKQAFISTWKAFDKNRQVTFTHGTQFRKGTDALVIRSSYTCLINPWYKHIRINNHLLSILKQNQCYKVFEIVLLECNCMTSLHEYELAIIACPCRQQLSTYCTYCRLTLAATEHSNILLSTRLLNDASQQMNISFPLDLLNNEIHINDSFHSRSGPYQHQRTIQIESEQILNGISEYEINLRTRKKLTNIPQSSFNEDADSSLSKSKSFIIRIYDIKQRSPDAIHSNENLSFEENTSEVLTKYITRGTQTKLFAILLPPSPLSETKQSEIEERTLRNITRTCQVNTLSYLIKTNDNQTEVEHPREDIWDIQRTDHSSTTSLLHTDTRLTKEVVSARKDVSIKSSIETKHYEHEINLPTIEFKSDELLDDFEERKINSSSANEEYPKEFIMTSSPLKCVNACDAVDLNEPTSLEPVDPRLKLFTKFFNNSNIHIINRQHRNKKRACGFLQHLRRQKKSCVVQLFSSTQHCSSYSSSFIITTDHRNGEKVDPGGS